MPEKFWDKLKHFDEIFAKCVILAILLRKQLGIWHFFFGEINFYIRKPISWMKAHSWEKTIFSAS